MEIKNISLKQVLRMKKEEGLVIECLDQEDLDDILNFFIDHGIITDKEAFKTVYFFDNEGIKQALLRFDHLRSPECLCPIGKLAIFRIQTHCVLAGTWLSDFIDIYKEHHKLNREGA